MSTPAAVCSSLVVPVVYFTWCVFVRQKNKTTMSVLYIYLAVGRLEFGGVVFVRSNFLVETQ